MNTFQNDAGVLSFFSQIFSYRANIPKKVWLLYLWYFDIRLILNNRHNTKIQAKNTIFMEKCYFFSIFFVLWWLFKIKNMTKYMKDIVAKLLGGWMYCISAP